MGGFKLTGLSAGSNSGDSLAYGLNSLNNLAAATGNYAMGGNTLTGLAAPNAAGEPLIYTTTTNTAVGNLALSNLTSGTQNTAFGDLALRFTTSGGANVGVGYSAGAAQTTGLDNVAVGASALALNTEGANIVAVGDDALGTFNDTGGGNDFLTAIGPSAGAADTTGVSNIFVGVGGNITSGSHNILLGNSLSDVTSTSNYQLDIGDTITATLVGGSVPNIQMLAPVNHLTGTIASLPSCIAGLVGAVASVTNSDSACSFNSTPAHSSCTVGTNCYTCQVQCAEAGSTSYAWIAY
jgi:hypothetical protein